MDADVIKKIEELFCKWYHIHLLDSTGFRGHDERAELVEYCSEHLEEFKDFAQDTLAHPQYCNFVIPGLCAELLPDVNDKITEPLCDSNMNDINGKALMEKLKDLFNMHPFEWAIWNECNIWLNYFNGTKDVEYYNDYMAYREYTHKHFIPWSPNTEEDPNPTYQEFIENRKKYKI